MAIALPRLVATTDAATPDEHGRLPRGIYAQATVSAHARLLTTKLDGTGEQLSKKR
jgi:hypothetical protein